MKNFKINKKIYLICIILSLINIVKVLGKDYEQVAVFEHSSLTITSYSKSWDEKKLSQLYTELRKNVTSDEFIYLKNINIYPDSPFGINGQYIEDVNLVDGKYVYGKNSVINLYNGEKYNTVITIAPILAHEYGHHYTGFNMLKLEGIYHSDIEKSIYGKLRKVKEFPVYYTKNTSKNYEYHWDLSEILADDYVQLLGSPYSKLSKDYKSSDELIQNKKLNNNGTFFNLSPSINPYIPLASEINGLYIYLLTLGGYTSTPPLLKKEPVLTNIEVTKTITNEPSFKINWTEAEGNGPFEYTLIMFPKTNPFSPIPLKTVLTGEKLEAIFGSYAIKDKNDKITSISNLYEGEFEIKLRVKDARGFIYDSHSIMFDFNIVDKYIKEKETEITSQKKEDKKTLNTTQKNLQKNKNNKNKEQKNKNNKKLGPTKTTNINLSEINFKK